MIRTPGPKQRISVVGRTGTGKTVAAVWHLSRAQFDKMPWVVYDFKRDELIARIQALGEESRVYEIGTDEVPRYPGIYIVHPHPDDLPLVRAQMMGIWERTNTGVYVDEGYMVCGPQNQNPSFRLLLTQGRALRIPMIIVSQKPSWMDSFTFSEADFFQIFDLTFRGDQKRVMEYVPADVTVPLPEFHSYYYDAARRDIKVLKPVPNGDKIIAEIDRRLEVLREKKKRVVVI
jgi:hypothetical protein